MNTLSIFLATLLLPQDEMPQAPAKSRAYHEARRKISTPSYELKKVQAMIKKIKVKVEDDPRIADKKVFNTLSTGGKFTYMMLHGENFSQNCDPDPARAGEEKMIFGFIPGMFDDEAAWSEEQSAWLKKNRTQVLKLVQETATKTGRFGLNLKHAVLEVDGRELFPFMASFYRKKGSDHDILSTMIQAMGTARYQPFVSTELGKLLTSEDTMYMAHAPATKQNVDMILKHGLAYASSKTVKKSK